MFNLIMVVFLLIVGTITAFTGYKLDNDATLSVGSIISGISIVWFFCSFISSLVHYSNQSRRFEDLRSSINKLKNNKQKQTDLLVEFKLYLGDKFPNLENKIFNDITNNSNIKILLKYPEIKSEKVLMKLVDKINDLAGDVYKSLNYIEDDCAWIRYYNKSKWEYFKASIPENLKEYIYKNN